MFNTSKRFKPFKLNLLVLAATEAFGTYRANAETDFICFDRVERIERAVLPIMIDFAINIEASKEKVQKE